jgi:ribbon-helix-helix CopG family protein
MARISASIPEDLKDELYQAATDSGQPISHIIVEALRSHLGSSGGTPRAGAAVDTQRVEAQLDQLTSEIQDLKEQLGSRTPPRGVRYF